MRFGRFQWTIVFGMALIAPCCAAGPARADLVPTTTPPAIGQFQAFVGDFGRWDKAHQNTPLVFLATTPDQQRSQALVMLWLLWMRDHGLVAGAGNGGGGTVISPPGNNNNPPPGEGANPPPAGGGGNPPPGGGHTSGSAPEPSSLALLSCGSLGLLAYRLVRSRVSRRG